MSNRTLIIAIVAILMGAVAVALLQSDGDGLSDTESARTPAESVGPAPSSPPGAAAAPQSDADEHQHPIPLLEVGTKAPGFELSRLDGGTFSLDDQRGQVVLINFWATWCEPCRDEMPDLQQIWEAYRDDGLLVVGVSLDVEGRPVVKEFHQTFPVEYPLLLDGLGVAGQYGADHVVPSSFIVGRDGRIADRHVGAIERESFEERLKSAL